MKYRLAQIIFYVKTTHCDVAVSLIAAVFFLYLEDVGAWFNDGWSNSLEGLRVEYINSKQFVRSS